VTTRARCLDAAREGAVAAARGEPGAAAAARVAPDDASVSVVPGPDTVVVTVEAPLRVLGGLLPGMTIRAAAEAALEPTRAIP
jgi:hypothetical protein